MKTKTWIIVLVERGFPSEVIVCENQSQTLSRARRESLKLNKDYDSLGVFCVDINNKKVEQFAIN